MKIFLVGYMGCGKSRMGKKLASKLERPFIDLDELIQTKHQATIPEIFAARGENGFREIERDTLQKSAIANNTIVSTGGGAPCFFDNMEWMNKNGLTIFIDPPEKVLADRLINAKAERPLIKGKSYDELLAFIHEKLAERRFFYEQAKIALKGVDLTVEEVVEAIEKENLEY
ncbi:Shikimate kinase [Pseudopedobacter saltans DSM 12145]|uniref:Shikimate kinase n=1 Tax=Pseudopedobacter saltans (strain ATCC 51119 / DSM 12145 / JCM 21818 / CCUG 39354 / LMG 10337 / NBRC 100064 / NCIMB 13643) TaxID=762903 RepID=F0S5N2_PSESL|nr:shikimate kinase [Pseudopedobacter saltans]ADY54206.1 Shikimate kinase [Pseudopedobacter saltans DSM 12145]